MHLKPFPSHSYNFQTCKPQSAISAFHSSDWRIQEPLSTNYLRMYKDEVILVHAKMECSNLRTQTALKKYILYLLFAQIR